MYKRVLSTFKKGLSLLALCSSLFSCALFENDVADFMETYTETAAIDLHTFSIPPYKDQLGNNCINSKQDFEIELFMRNPKKFTMNPSISFDNLSTSIDASRVSIKQTDLYTLKVVMPQEFLLDADEGKDLTAKFRLYEPMSGRVFAGYEIPLFCNTVPPQVQNATILNDDNKTFVIFFDMPNAEELAIRHKDIAFITINGTDFPVSIADDGSFTFESDRFLSAPKPSYSMIDAKEFSNSDRSVYFETQEAFFMGEKAFTLGLKDKAGLIQTVYTNTEISRLSRVEIKDIDGVVYSNGANEMVAGSDVDPFKITLTPPTRDHKGNTIPGLATLHYALYKGTSTVSALIKEASSESAVTLEMTEGTYYLETYATRTNYEQSPLSCVTLRVVDSAIYVSEDGDDATADGTRELPFSTLQAAIDDVDVRNMPTAKLNIYVSGTLRGTAVVNPTIAKELVISGRPGSVATIDAQGRGPALTIDTAVPIILKNITITNGSAEKGGAVYLPSGAKLAISDGVIITGNTAGVNGGAVYAGSNIELSGAVQIYDNVDSAGAACNLFIPDGIKLKITDSLASNGSKSNIGITTQTIPTILTPVTITEGYGFNGGNNSGVVPGTYFTGDAYAASFDETSGEVVIAVNGGSITDVLSTLKFTFELNCPGHTADGKLWFTAGASGAAARTIRVVPTITIADTDVTAEALADTSNPVEWNIELFINGFKVPDCTFTSLEFVIPQSVNYQDIYSLHVQATWNGMSFDDEFTVYGYDPS